MPARIRKIFITEEVNQQQYYSVLILCRGKWKIIDLDEMIPVHFDTQLPAFSKSVREELWVILLEKAWAKIFHGYEKIEAGFPE